MKSDELFTGERFVPGIQEHKLEIEHFQRYLSVCEIVKGKSVLDAACGEGYGSNILAETAKDVIGVDIDEGAVDRAGKLYGFRDNLRFEQGDIEKLNLQDNSIDVVVSFETVEHVDEETQNNFLHEIERVLKTDGILIMSTPNKAVYSDRHDHRNRFHKKEFYHDEFIAFLHQKFQYVQLYNQTFCVLSIIDRCDRRDEVIKYYSQDKKYNNEGKYYIAVASRIQLNKIPLASLYVDDLNEYENNISRILTLQKEEEARNNHIQQLNIELEEYGNVIRSLQKENTQRDQHIRYLDSVIEKNDRMLSAYRTEIDRGKQQLELQRRSTDKQLQKFTQQNLINEQRIASLEQTLRNKEGHIEQLLEAERAFEREKGTHAYKVGKKIQKFGDLLLPPDSHRRFLARVVFNTFRHPVVMSNVINPARIKKYFKYRKSGDMEGIKRGFGEAIRTEKMCLSGNEISEVPILTAAGDRFDKMAFQIFNEPTVSIVIPVYNEFQYTYNCLMSILNHSGDVAYEIIIADDRSTDQTKDITDIVSGIKVVRTAENLRFLRNCNHAAKHAEGKYILFLNNDTQVQENWLQPLVRLIESDERIGMVGSKLIYPDGYLQEAGGILWKDGSAWNYGNRKNPEDPEYNYVKEADYISGAAVMIKRSLWHKIGGFDERFVPAYCEDSDLAFAVRAQGYKVLYQPLSVVVHFEGVSNGTDLSGGQKLYQTKNQQKLVEKWTEVLERDHFPNAENVFTARDRNRYKPVLLMVDHYVPQYDKDAGSRTVFQYLKMFVDKGYL